MSTHGKFEEAFLSMWSGPRVPDAKMHVELEGPICRYVGAGNQTYDYSISFVEGCADERKVYEIVRREKELAATRGRNHEWKQYGFPSVPGLAACLQSQGYVVDRRCTLMFAPVSHELPGASDGALRTIRAESAADLIALDEVSQAVWGSRMGDLLTSLEESLKETDPLTDIYLVKSGEQLIAGAWIKYYNEIGFLFGGATRKEFRGRGAYRALVAARMRDARRRGVRYVMSECSPDSERVLRALGFESAGEALRYVLAGAGQ